MIDVNEFVNLTEPQEDRSLFKLGIVHSLFDNNTAKILFDGEDEPSEKEYSYSTPSWIKLMEKVLGFSK
mgnify:CR=1 FL=1